MHVVQQIFPIFFVISWVGIAITLFLRLRAKQRDYLRRFPPVAGIPLDMYMGGNPFGAVNRAIFRVSWRRQADPELEQFRRAVWRRSRALAFWTVGFPLLTFAIVALLILAGYVH
ncbi:MAG: hypothetical protein OJF49_001934 [Ktedonobacterales bacterium]|jgi:hypothetical protein|nr:MAG: hypothetical protein OJF49_001934 [Ktedonobacterales bacterium]